MSYLDINWNVLHFTESEEAGKASTTVHPWLCKTPTFSPNTIYTVHEKGPC